MVLPEILLFANGILCKALPLFIFYLKKKSVFGSIHPDPRPAETCPPMQLRTQLYFLFICLLIPENNVRAASVRGCRRKHRGLYLCTALCRSGPASSARCHSTARWPGHFPPALLALHVVPLSHFALAHGGNTLIYLAASLYFSSISLMQSSAIMELHPSVPSILHIVPQITI